jgi:hypothetical protein
MAISSPFIVSTKKKALRRWLKSKWYTPATYPPKTTLSVLNGGNYLYEDCIFRLSVPKLSGKREMSTFLVFVDDDDDIIEDTIRMYIAMCIDQKDYVDMFETRFYCMNLPDIKMARVPELK